MFWWLLGSFVLGFLAGLGVWWVALARVEAAFATTLEELE